MEGHACDPLLGLFCFQRTYCTCYNSLLVREAAMQYIAIGVGKIRLELRHKLIHLQGTLFGSNNLQKPPYSNKVCTSYVSIYITQLQGYISLFEHKSRIQSQWYLMKILKLRQ
jgi:hypothetical protein